MLNMPFMPATNAQMEPSSASKQTASKQEDSGFSDVYEKMDDGRDRPKEDVNESRSSSSESSDDSPKETDSRTQNENESERTDRKDDTRKDATSETEEEADFTVVEVAEAPDDAPKTPRGDGEIRVPKAAREIAALMRLAPQSDEGAQTAATAKTVKTEAPAPATPAVDADAAPDVEVARATNAQSAKLMAETPDGLDPMRVTVRSQAAQQAQVVEAAKPNLAQQTTVKAEGRETPRFGAEMVEEVKAPKPETPSIPTTSTAQQMQARAIMEQVNAGTKQINVKADLQAGQSIEPFIAAAEESSNSSRSIMSAQEAASQARLTNSAPNPAYVVRQLADAVRMSDKNLIELAMDPPELGKVRMSMSEAGGVMTVSIAAENQATSELMRRHIDMLRKDFMELGYQDVSFSFEQNGRDGQQAQSEGEFGQGSGGSGGRDEGPLIADPATLAAQTPPTRTGVSSGLDIRV